MARYKWAGSDAREDVTSETTLGYPWVEVDETTNEAEGETEIAAGTADAILAEVGDDPVKARAALEAEEKRENPRVGLTRKLERIAGD